MPRNRQIYQTSLIFVTSGANTATGRHIAGATWGNTGNFTGIPLISQVFRVQSFNDDWSNQLTDINQFGELAAIDRVALTPPTVNVSFNYLLSNLVNEANLGLTVNRAGDAAQVSCISGILAGTTDAKNYFCKIVDDGQDASDYNPATYDVRSFGNCFLNSYTVQGQVGSFPTVDVSLTALNAQLQSVAHAAGARIPAVIPADGSAITGWGFMLPTGLTSQGNGVNTNSLNIAVLRPKDITLSLGLNGGGDSFASESDIKIQNFNLSFNLNREDLNKLGSKFAFAKVPQFPVQATLAVNALLGDNATGYLTDIVNNNRSYNPSITITAPDSSAVIAHFQLRGAKLASQSFTQSIGQNQAVSMQFTAQIGGPQSTEAGVFMSGITI